jgi:transposase
LRILAEHYKALAIRIARLDAIIFEWHRKNEDTKRLMTIPGIGVVTATALVASIGDASAFKSGRSLSAWLGLVPKQSSSGEAVRLGQISRAGDSYLRSLFYIAASSTLRIKRSRHRIVRWARRLLRRKKFKVAAVALANKLARIAWAELRYKKNFDPKRQLLPSHSN